VIFRVGTVLLSVTFGVLERVLGRRGVVIVGVIFAGVVGVALGLVALDDGLALDDAGDPEPPPPQPPPAPTVLTVNVRVRGVGSILPAGSIARIRRVCAHSERLV
jgi:hypothetical protein